MRITASLAAVFATLALSVGVGQALASQLIDRNATQVRLAVNAQGEALVTYRARGRLHHVLSWGAINARQPTSGRPQVRFRKDYAGGWGR